MSPTSTAADVIEGVDLSGQVAVITGASGGIGLETARALASAGATVVLANRTSAKSDAAAAELRTTVPGGDVELGALDLMSLASVRDFAGWVGARHDRIDLLLNNAGVMATPFGRTADGFEQQFGINHLGHFLLTNLLMRRLLAAAPARIVNVSSHGHQLAGISWDDPNYHQREYEPWQAYGQSKTANLLFTQALERRFGAHGVHAYAVHPGLVATDLGRNLAEDDRARFEQRMKQPGILTKTPAQGAATSVLAATSAELLDHGGSYLEDCHLSDAVAPHAADAADAERLWALSEELVGETFPPQKSVEEVSVMDEQLRAAGAMRRAMLGDEYVDRMAADSDRVGADFQDYITSMAWGVWAREGALSTRDRSLLVMAMTAALGRMEEFRLHAGAMQRTGVTDDELDELLFQIAAYCGAPAAIAARREVRAMRAARDADDNGEGSAHG